MRQAWVPRALNVAIAIFLLACVSPVVTRFDDQSTSVKVYLVLAIAPVLLVVLLCLASAARPGSLGRAARRMRKKRS